LAIRIAARRQRELMVVIALQEYVDWIDEDDLGLKGVTLTVPAKSAFNLILCNLATEPLLFPFFL